MIGRVDDVKIISSIQNKSVPNKKIQSRTAHGFVFRKTGYAEYFANGRVYRVNEGEVAFLPKGSCYEISTYESEYMSINFEANIEKPEISVYSLKDFHGAYNLIFGFSELWNFGSTADRYKCFSDFYDLLSYISRLEHLGNSETGNYSKIEPAMEYLREHIYDPGLKVDKLHHLCGISDTYFRRIFVSRFAMTPREYLLFERINRARLIIESGDYESIKAVSESVGYSDPLYFSKAFRKYYGFPPSGMYE
jgi:AraC-like DNA-binding protein